jgi:hypothetical protein
MTSGIRLLQKESEMGVSIGGRAGVAEVCFGTEAEDGFG